jgi:hypothetical protein
MIGDIARRAVLEEGFRECKHLRAEIRLDNKPVGMGETPDESPLCRYTLGMYYLIYRRATEERYADKPYLLVCDLYRMQKVRFSGWRECETVSYSKNGTETSLVTRWLIQNCGLSEDTFRAARNNLGIDIVLGFRMTDYMKKVSGREDMKQIITPYDCSIDAYIEEKRKNGEYKGEVQKDGSPVSGA